MTLGAWIFRLILVATCQTNRQPANMVISLWSDKEKGAETQVQGATSSAESVIQYGDVKFTAAEGGNSSRVTYQNAVGAPVETNSPLGYSVSFWVSLTLNINQMVGSGIFSTRESSLLWSCVVRRDVILTRCKAATILQGVGSVGLTMIYWFIGYLLAQSVLIVYLELASYFPSRSGSDVVYLEQAYPKPRYFFPTIFAIKHVVFSFGSSNAIVLAEYLFGLAGASYTPWQLKGVAVAGYTVALIGIYFCGLDLKISKETKFVSSREHKYQMVTENRCGIWLYQNCDIAFVRCSFPPENHSLTKTQNFNSRPCYPWRTYKSTRPLYQLAQRLGGLITSIGIWSHKRHGQNYFFIRRLRECVWSCQRDSGLNTIQIIFLLS